MLRARVGKQPGCVFGALFAEHHGLHDASAPDVDEQVQVEERAARAGGQVRYVPAPDLVGAGRDELLGTLHRSRLARTTMRHESFGAKDAVERRFRCDILAAVGEARNDLLRRVQVAKFRGVRRLDHDLALFVSEFLLRRRVRSLAPVAGPVTLFAPTLHRARVQLDLAACRRETAAVGHGLGDQGESGDAELVHVSSPSPPRGHRLFFLGPEGPLSRRAPPPFVSARVQDP